MYLYIFEINGRKHEELNPKADYLSTLIEQNINENELADFYTDQELFIKEQTSGYVLKPHKKLFLVETDQTGWDTYDSAVYCAWTEKEAIEMSENKMGSSYYPYHNTVKEIGKANKNLDIGEVVSSFNAG